MDHILDSRIQNTTVDIVGDRLFGRSLRLRVALWVESRRDLSFFLAEAAKGVDYGAGNVADELSRLTELGMVARAPKVAGDRRQYYTRIAHPLWDVVSEARAALGEMSQLAH